MAENPTLMRMALNWARPLAIAVARAQVDAARPGEVVIAPAGDASAAAELAGLIDAREGPAQPRDLMVGVASPRSANPELAAVIGEHRRAGGDALVVVVGSPVERRRIEQELSGDRDVGISVMVMVDSVQGDGLARVRRRVARVIISRREGLRPSHPSLNPDIARKMERRAAVRMALRAALAADAVETASAMTSTHARLAADSTTMADERVDPRTLGLVFAMGLLSPLWRRLGGRLNALVPFTRIVVRGGIAYSVTRLVGIGARRVAMRGRAPHQEER